MLDPLFSDKSCCLPLQEVSPRRCDRRYLEILEQAAKEGESAVDDALRLLLQTATGRQTIVNKEALFSERAEDKLTLRSCR